MDLNFAWCLLMTSKSFIGIFTCIVSYGDFKKAELWAKDEKVPYLREVMNKIFDFSIKLAAGAGKQENLT